MTTVTASRSIRLLLAVAVVIGCAVGAIAVPSSARADAPTQIVQFSSDGIHWKDALSGQLFGDVLIVPDTSATRSFYLRNAATESARLTITLFDVTTNDLALADAMSLSTSVPGNSGATYPVERAAPCLTVNSGAVMTSGQVLRVDTQVSLADLTGTVGQMHAVGFRLLVTLSSTDTTVVPDTCPADSGSVGILPPPTIPTDTPTPSGTATTATPAATVYRHASTGWVPVPSTGTGTIGTPTTPTSPTDPTSPFVQTLVSNTARLYQEYDVAFWLAMSALGAVIVVVMRRRRADQPELEQHRQIGIDR